MSIEDAVESVAPARAFTFSTVIGLDPSLTGTGLALITAAGFVSTTVVRTKPAPGLSGTRERLRHVRDVAMAWVPAGSLVLVEKLYIPQGRGADGSLIDRAGLWWLTVDALLELGCVVAEVAPATRAKLAASNGNAKKADVTAAMRERFPATPISDDNVADALALAAAAAHWAGFPADGPLTAKQQEAMTAVPWPARGASDE